MGLAALLQLCTSESDLGQLVSNIALFLLSLGFKHFQNIFGKSRVATHFDNLEHFTAEVEEHFRAAKNSNEARKYITCTTYKTGVEAKSALVENYGGVNVHTLYTSAHSNAACFLVSGEMPSRSVLRGKDYNLRYD